jgi:hypothetical protein
LRGIAGFTPCTHKYIAETLTCKADGSRWRRGSRVVVCGVPVRVNKVRSGWHEQWLVVGNARKKGAEAGGGSLGGKGSACRDFWGGLVVIVVVVGIVCGLVATAVRRAHCVRRRKEQAARD